MNNILMFKLITVNHLRGQLFTVVFLHQLKEEQWHDRNTEYANKDAKNVFPIHISNYNK